jgi:hypothetical protein
VIPDGGIRPIEAMQIIGRAIYNEQKKPIDILVSRARLCTIHSGGAS